MNRRVVVTGLGVIAPNGLGIAAFEKALREGVSGIRFQPEMAEYDFACQVAGVPEGVEKLAGASFSEEQRMGMNSGITFASLAALEAWKDAGLRVPAWDEDAVDAGAGAIIGTGIGGMDTTGGRLVPMTNDRRVRRLGSTIVEQVMASGVSAKVSGLLALGNQVSTNSSACSTGTEAVIQAAQRIRAGLAERMLAGGSEGASRFIWAGFDAMRVLNRNSNDAPERASRPMSASAGGFIPAAGSGILMLESLDSALKRGVTIYAEFLGGAVNCGGQRGGGSMTAPNPDGVRRCIQGALAEAGLKGSDVDAVSGHLTATFADPQEIRNWQAALELEADAMPMINSPKSLFGHALGAAGGLECVASVLQVARGFVHGSLNCEDLHEELKSFERAVVRRTREVPDLRVQAKASFGFGDVNACVLFGKFDNP